MEKHIINIKKINNRIEKLQSKEFSLNGEYISAHNNSLDPFLNHLMPSYRRHDRNISFTKDFQHGAIAALICSTFFTFHNDKIILPNGVIVRPSKIKWKINVSLDSIIENKLDNIHCNVICSGDQPFITIESKDNLKVNHVNISYFKSGLMKDILKYLSFEEIKKHSTNEVTKSNEEQNQLQKEINTLKREITILEEIKREYNSYLIFEKSISSVVEAIDEDNLEEFSRQKWWSVKHKSRKEIEEKMK